MLFPPPFTTKVPPEVNVWYWYPPEVVTEPPDAEKEEVP
jgi:hypothetical protein